MERRAYLEVRVEVGVVAQVLVELHGCVTHGLVKHVLVAVEEGAALEDGAAPLRNELLGGEEDGLQGEALEVLSIDIHVRGEAQPLEALGEGRLVEPHGILVGIDLRKVVPVVLEGLGGDQGTPVGMEVGLKMTGQVPLQGVPEGVSGSQMEPGDSPEVDVSTRHLGEHLLEGVHRSHDGGVEQDDLVELDEPVPAVALHGRLVGPGIQALVLPQDDVVREGGQLGIALGGQLTVDDNDQLGEVLDHISEQGLHVGVHDALSVEEEEDPESLRVLAERCHNVPSGQWFEPLTVAEERSNRVSRARQPALEARIRRILVGSPHTPGES